MLADPEDIRRKNGLKLCKILSSFSEIKVSYWLIEVQDIEGKEIDVNLDLIDGRCLPRSCR